MSNNELVRPFLKWVGGKRQLVPSIIENYLPENYHKYYEPFLGGGALFLALQPDKATINDTNSELVNCYRVIRDCLDKLIKVLKEHKSALNSCHSRESYYYEVREWDRKDDYNYRTEVERAARIIFLNKTCYNGLFRVNSQGQFNAPFGRYKNPNFLDEPVLKAVSEYLNNSKIEILNVDFQAAIKDANKNDFIYFDPPYDPVSNTASFTGYSADGFNKSQQERLKLAFTDLDKRGCKVLLSNACTTFIEELYSDYSDRTVKIAVPRAINSNGLKRGNVDEVLIMNYELKSPLD